MGRRIPGLTSERRWRRTRKLGCYCARPGLQREPFPVEQEGCGSYFYFGSAIIRGKSLNVLSSREGRAARLHWQGHQPPTAPLQAPRGHDTTRQSSALRNDNFPTILEAEQRGAKGKSATGCG